MYIVIGFSVGRTLSPSLFF